MIIFENNCYYNYYYSKELKMIESEDGADSSPTLMFSLAMF
jgi:hypothetical protein